MYSLTDITDALRNPHKIIRELNSIYHNRFYCHSYNPDGIGVLRKDWDNLILLDSCRYDTFEKCSELSGDLKKEISKGSHSREFVRGNFSNSELYDTVVVSANTYYKKLSEKNNINFHDMVFLPHRTDKKISLNDDGRLPDKWEKAYQAYGDRIDPPELITNKAIKTAKKYPNKRLIIHYMQPHRPYIGSYGVEKFGEYAEPLSPALRKEKYDITPEENYKAYIENLELVLEEAEKLMNKLAGKTVVSADHGELLGEKQFPIPLSTYGHAEGLYVSELTEIPWLEYRSGTRKDVISEEPNEMTGVSDDEMEEINKHLIDLGYEI